MQAHDVPDFLDEKGIVGQLERLCPMRLDPKQREPALYGALGDPLGLGDQTRENVIVPFSLWAASTVARSPPTPVASSCAMSCERRVVASKERRPREETPPLARRPVGSPQDGLCPGVGSSAQYLLLLEDDGDWEQVSWRKKHTVPFPVTP